jgi:hypothetical protein
MDYLGSMYIDNELDLGEKVQFIEKIHSEKEFFQETLDLLVQEKLLRTMPEKLLIPAETRIHHDLKNWLAKFFRPVVYGGAGFALATLLLLLLTRSTVSPDQISALNRFVIYEPTASKVELTGTFNGWQRVAMQQIGNSGYWELNLQLPSGEYRFAYILDGAKRMTDPTQPAREKDDFGGENSILKVAKRA